MTQYQFNQEHLSPLQTSYNLDLLSGKESPSDYKEDFLRKTIEIKNRNIDELLK